MGHARTFLAILVLGGIAAALSPGVRGQASEPALKAAVVVKLAGFVAWPEGAAEGFALCVFGDGPLASSLEAEAGKPARAGVVSVRRRARAERADGCHAAVVAGEDGRLLAQVAEANRRRPVLLVAEGEAAVERGAMVGLALAGDRVAFDLNRTEAAAAGLELSSKLLRLARRVQ